jgi:hypothetical protein
MEGAGNSSMIRGKLAEFFDRIMPTNKVGNAMGNFFGDVDDQSIQAMHIMGSGWIYAFFIIGACLLAAGGLVRWQVRRIERILAHVKAEGADAPGSGGSGSGTGEAPRG